MKHVFLWQIITKYRLAERLTLQGFPVMLSYAATGVQREYISRYPSFLTEEFSASGRC